MALDQKQWILTFEPFIKPTYLIHLAHLLVNRRQWAEAKSVVDLIPGHNLEEGNKEAISLIAGCLKQGDEGYEWAKKWISELNGPGINDLRIALIKRSRRSR